MNNVSAVAISGNCGNLVIICCLKREILLEEEQLTTLSLARCVQWTLGFISAAVDAADGC